MVQLKMMRRVTREGINKIAQLEQRSSQDSVKSYFVRIKKLFEDKLLMAQGDRQMTQRLFKRMSEFPFDYAQRLDEAKEMREAVKKANTAKSIIRNFIRNLKQLARHFEDSLVEISEEDERRAVRTYAQLASQQLKINFQNRALVNLMDEEIEMLQKLCDLWEDIMIKYT